MKTECESQSALIARHFVAFLVAVKLVTFEKELSHGYFYKPYS